MSSEPQNSLTVSFVQHELSPLKGGKYEIIVGQSIDLPEDQNDPAATRHLPGKLPDKHYHFAVYTERFQLRPDEIVKVFPPEDSHGDYTQVLPHVMLSRATLPWERAPGIQKIEGTPNLGNHTDVAPWLAVLLFDQDDPPPTAQTPPIGKDSRRTIRDLLYDDPGVVQANGSVQDASKGGLPPHTLSYFPQKSWLDLLEYSESLEDACEVIDVPVDLWNRVAPSMEDLPWLAHTRTMSYGDGQSQSYALVNGNRMPVEGHVSTAHLVSLEGMAEYLPGSEQDSHVHSLEVDYIRLISLKSWKFTTNQAHGNFGDILKSLNGADCQTKPIDGFLRIPSAEVQNKMVKNALDQGCTALVYQTRTGSQAVSWYHGPLVPFKSTASVELPIRSADDLIYIDAEHGIYDASYAAAWQLGRLMALSSRSFSTGLHRWKADEVQKMVLLAGKAGQNSELDRRQRRAFYANVTKLLQADDVTPEQKSQKIQTIRALYSGKIPVLDPDLLAWLSNLYLLQGVPFWYLVPDERMLPPESLRFFCIDAKWLKCLIDGAMSISRATLSVFRHDQVFADDYFSQVQNTVHGAGSDTEPGPTLSGFLLRSQAIKGWWPGIQADAMAGDRLLEQLRLERLSDSILLGLFDGEVSQVTIHEPPEGIHFGVDKSIAGDLEREGRVLAINQLAARLRQEYGESFTSAEFALKMVARRQSVIIKLI